jgi:hypothetical protein
METGRLELAAGVGERGPLPWHTWSLREEPIDVEHPEADAFHVKGADGDDERFALGDQSVSAHLGRAGLEEGNQGVDVVLGGLAVIHRKN